MFSRPSVSTAVKHEAAADDAGERRASKFNIKPNLIIDLDADDEESAALCGVRIKEEVQTLENDDSKAGMSAPKDEEEPTFKKEAKTIKHEKVVKKEPGITSQPDGQMKRKAACFIHGSDSE